MGTTRPVGLEGVFPRIKRALLGNKGPDVPAPLTQMFVCFVSGDGGRAGRGFLEVRSDAVILVCVVTTKSMQRKPFKQAWFLGLKVNLVVCVLIGIPV